MPYSGIGDSSLPKAVQRLPKHLRGIWVAVFNENYDAEDEGKAFRIAWAAVRNAQKEKEKMTWDWKRTLAEAARALNLEPPFLSEGEAEVAEAAAERADKGGTGNEAETETRSWRTGLKISADAETGRPRWTAISSGGFEDRDREVVSTAFLESCVATADKIGNRGTVDLLHVDGFEVGKCDFQAVIGEPGMLLESGLFDDTEAGRRAAAFYSRHADETGVSLKFYYVHRTEDGVYLPPGLIVKRSLMPKTWAAFPWSAITVKEANEMAKGGLSAEKRAELERILGADLVEQIEAQVGEDAEALKGLGVRFKEAAEEDVKREDVKREEEKAAAGKTDDEEEKKPAVEEPAPSADEEDEDEEDEEVEEKQAGDEVVSGGPSTGAQDAGHIAQGPGQPMELLLSDEALSAVAEKATAGLQALIAPIAEGQEMLRAALSKIAADVELLKRGEDERVAEKVRNLPRATVKAMTAQPVMRPSQREAVADGETGAVQPGSLHEKGLKALYGNE